MNYKVNYSLQANQDIEDIYEYIAYELLAQNAAGSQIKRIMQAAHSLENMPQRFPLFKEEPWRSEGLRFVPLDNYLIFYLTDEQNHEVNILRIMYAARDIQTQLESTTE